MVVKKYSNDWQTVSRKLKKQYNYQCQSCGKQCYKPGEIPKEQPRSHWTANVLQAHHKNYNSLDNSLDNLTVLCSACHLHTHSLNKYSSYSKGQLSLEF